jgi:superoxide reductase
LKKQGILKLLYGGKMKELIIKKCNKCKAIVRVIEDCNYPCGIVCCGEEMKALKANSTDGAMEKHVPTYEIKDDEIIVEVNHVMDEDHYIEWICAISENEEQIKYLKPGMKAKARFKLRDNMTLYSYCNKHSLWKLEVTE